MVIAVWMIAILGLLTAQTPSPAATPSFNNIYRAAVEDAAAWVTPGLAGARPVIEVDPRVLGTNGTLPAPGAELHPAQAIAGAAVADRLVVMTLARAEQCRGIGARTCRNNGAWVGVVLEAPVITGETATMKMLVRMSRPPTDAEKAGLQSTARGRAGAARFSEEVGGVTLFQLSLVSKDGAWSVASRKIIGQS
jgi:hypothetical protein